MTALKYLEDMDFGSSDVHLRDTRIGLWVDESTLGAFYNKVLDHVNWNFPDERLSRKRLKKTVSSKNKFYLIDESDCFVGYCLGRVDLEGVLTTDAALVSCQLAIHERDPFFSKPGSKIGLLGDGDNYAVFRGRDRDYIVESHAFNQFSKRLDHSRKMKNNSDFLAPLDLRDKLMILNNFLKGSREVERQNSVLQTIKYGFVESEYRANNNWVFVLEGDVLKTCYEVWNLEKKGYRFKEN